MPYELIYVENLNNTNIFLITYFKFCVPFGLNIKKDITHFMVEYNKFLIILMYVE